MLTPLKFQRMPLPEIHLPEPWRSRISEYADQGLRPKMVLRYNHWVAIAWDWPDGSFVGIYCDWIISLRTLCDYGASLDDIVRLDHCGLGKRIFPGWRFVAIMMADSIKSLLRGIPWR